MFHLRGASAELLSGLRLTPSRRNLMLCTENQSSLIDFAAPHLHEPRFAIKYFRTLRPQFLPKQKLICCQEMPEPWSRRENSFQESTAWVVVRKAFCHKHMVDCSPQGLPMLLFHEVDGTPKSVGNAALGPGILQLHAVGGLDPCSPR